ncbi:MAG: ribosome-associated translation inhibitor RaiA [Paludibacteraceae bacterium]|nr:ribosome-associated translation inhibitor RaiA [Paludibacteraceae bacterium]
MKLNINSVNFEIAERLEKYIEKKTHRYERLLPNEEVIMELRLTVIKPETNLNKQTQIRILGNGPELFAEKTCDTFEQGIDLCLEALDKQLEKLKQR